MPRRPRQVIEQSRRVGSIVLLLVGAILALRLRRDLPFGGFDIYSAQRWIERRQRAWIGQSGVRG